MSLSEVLLLQLKVYDIKFFVFFILFLNKREIVLFGFDLLFNPLFKKNSKVLGLRKLISSLSELMLIILINELSPLLFTIFSI